MAEVIKWTGGGDTPDDNMGLCVYYMCSDLFPYEQLVFACVKMPTVHVYSRLIKLLTTRPDQIGLFLSYKELF